MDYFNKFIHNESELGNMKIKKSFKYNKNINTITPSNRKKSFDDIFSAEILEFKGKKPTFFIGICGGQASGKKKISEYFHKSLENSETINEMSFFNPDEKKRKISKEDEYLIKDCDFYSKERRLYHIDMCNPESYDYDKFYDTLKSLSEGQKVKIPYFDENECKFVHEKDKTIDPSKTPLIIIYGCFIFRNEKIKDFLNLKLYKELEDDVRLSRLVLREAKYLKNNTEAYEMYFSIYEKFYKICYDEYISTYKKVANILLPDYNFTEDNKVEDETLEFLLYNLKNLSKKNN